MSDWDLPSDPIAALRDGNPGPFEAFVRDHARSLFAFFRRQGAGMHEAEDLVQEVFLKLHHHAPRYRPQERFPAFCMRVARNVLIDHRRRKAARIPGPTGPAGATDAGAASVEPRPAPVSQEPPRRAELVEEVARLRAAVAGLPEHQRAVFELGVVEELAYAEIGSLLDIPVGTVKSRMFHAVRSLRRLLGEEDEEGVA